MGRLIKDLTGQRFGRLVALELSPERTKDGKTKWICKCDCGNTVTVQSASLVSGRTGSCGCLYVNDLVGQRFGRLVAVKLLSKRKCGYAVWQCQCSCGNIARVLGCNLVSGNTKSCGCLHRELSAKQAAARVGPTHPSWDPSLTAEQRAANRNYPEYKEWREAVYERDNYTCQYCEERGGNLNAHHLEGYANNPELRTALENGITLCKKHHKDFHHQYGNNATREQFAEWMSKREMNND